MESLFGGMSQTLAQRWSLRLGVTVSLISGGLAPWPALAQTPPPAAVTAEAASDGAATASDASAAPTASDTGAVPAANPAVTAPQAAEATPAASDAVSDAAPANEPAAITALRQALKVGNLTRLQTVVTDPKSAFARWLDERVQGHLTGTAVVTSWEVSLTPLFAAAADIGQLRVVAHLATNDTLQTESPVRLLAGGRLQPLPSVSSLSLPITAHALKVRVEPLKGSLAVTDTITTKAQAGQTYLLRLSPQLTVTALSMSGRKLTGERQGDNLVLTIPAGTRPGPLQIAYNGTWTAGPYDFVNPNSVLLRPESDWYPQALGPASPTTFKTSLQVVGLTGLATGVSSGAGIWQPVRPVNGVALAAGRFVTKSRKVGNVTVTVHVSQESARFAATLLDEAAKVLGFATAKLGGFPFTTLTISETDVAGGYGGEGMVSLGSRVLANKRSRSLLGCTQGTPMQTSQAGRAVAFVPRVDWEWPLLPTADGWLVGGSGFVSGMDPPVGVSPGLGLGALLIPSHPVGRLWGFDGDLPPPKRFLPPRVVWLPAPASRPPSPGSPIPSQPPSPRPPVPRATPLDLTGPLAPAWTKAGPSLISVPQRQSWPTDPWFLTPWGPLTPKPGPLPSGVNLLALGFPPADGTPVQATYGVPWFLTDDGGVAEVMLLDLISRAVYRPPLLQHSRTDIIIDAIGPVALYGPARGIGRLHLVDLLTGSEDPLPDVPPIDADVILGGAQMTQYGETIVYATGERGCRRVHLFDRRSRQTLRLERLNRGRELINPCIDWYGRCILATATGPDSDVLLYDTRTGLTDPLPAVNTSANERSADLAVNGFLVLYTTDAPGHREARLYDRRTGAIDTLPDLNRLGPILSARCSNDGALIAPIYVADGQLRIALYDRHSGMIDPLPDLNPPGRNRLPAAR